MDQPASCSNLPAKTQDQSRAQLTRGQGLDLAYGAASVLTILAAMAFFWAPAPPVLKPKAVEHGAEPAPPLGPRLTPALDPGLLGSAPGLYQIGPDLQPGEYVLVGDSAYFKVMSKNSGEPRHILVNDAFNRRSILTLTKGTFLYVENARLFPMEKAPKVELAEGLLPEGMYKVGVDLPPGSYQAVPDGSGYLEISRNSSHALTAIVSNDVLVRERTITLRTGQYLKLASAHLVLK